MRLTEAEFDLYIALHNINTELAVACALRSAAECVKGTAGHSAIAVRKILALTPASAQRAVELDRLEARIEEAKWQYLCGHLVTPKQRIVELEAQREELRKP